MTRRRLTSLTLVTLLAAVVAVTATTSGGAQRKASHSLSGSSVISLRQTSVGNVLVDANGRTLYLFALDKPNVSRLSAAGPAVWPPFTSTAVPAARGGVSRTHIGRIPASKQVTSNGHPLYYYVGDQRSGDILGQGLNQFGARWYVLSAAGTANKSLAPHAAASQPERGSYAGEGTGYAY